MGRSEKIPEDSATEGEDVSPPTVSSGESQGGVSADPATGRSSARPVGGGADSVGEMLLEPGSRIGRYLICSLLGKGGFGAVYLADDDQLGRSVAIKVPARRLIARPEDAALYLAEARTVANLDHPHIVPVYDVGTTDLCPFFIVTKFVPGQTLANWLREQSPSFETTARLLATIAEALDFAHRSGLVHRDVKPGNILIADDGTPFLIDFGLALRDEQVGRGPRYVGTPAYMSPEQARGEGHRVDGRSDVYSLGCVMYEMLTRKRPFRASRKSDLLEQVAFQEPKPPRQINANVPRELERICLKALRKRSADRYTTADDMAEELRWFVRESQHSSAAQSVGESSRQTTRADSTVPVEFSRTVESSSRPLAVVPKGLRSFDRHDSDFFLSLVPGPRDRDGLPDCLRSWKIGIEEQDAEKTFPVGLMYGPSGCGKSSLLKAGLLPRLSDEVLPVCIEAAIEGTEAYLLHRIRRVCPHVDPEWELAETLAWLRQNGVPGRAKLLLVIDQFEQWLHAHRIHPAAELIQALRQCDGGRLQALVLVRDDFWLAVSRFMKALEVDVIEGWNSALIDLFDPLHARKVLTAFGVAYGRLPADVSSCSPEQNDFLDQAVAELVQEGKVVPVRLAVFAEMVKGKPWTTDTLRRVGGTGGIGVSFLEETFSASTAPPQRRLHEQAAEAVLRRLLPEPGTQIKAQVRSEQDLLQASGYAEFPQDFHDLIRILDRDVRLITPTEPVGQEESSDSSASTQAEAEGPAQSGAVSVKEVDADSQATPDTRPAPKHYQLTHDYLVRPIRQWLTRKQQATSRGRAELRLSEFASLWKNTPNPHVLPTFWETVQLRLLTSSGTWSPGEREVMGRATRMHARRAAGLAVVLGLLGFFGVQAYRSVRAAGLVDSLLTAKTTEVPQLLTELDPYLGRVEPELRQVLAQPAGERSVRRDRATTAQGLVAVVDEEDQRRRLHASLALLPVDPGQLPYLERRLLDASPAELRILLPRLRPHRDQVVQSLQAKLRDEQSTLAPAQLLRAATVLAAYVPDDETWKSLAEPVGGALIEVGPAEIDSWVGLLDGAAGQLVAPLTDVFGDVQRISSERVLAARALVRFADQSLLGELILDADPEPFQYLFPVIAADPGPWPRRFGELLRQSPPEEPDARRRQVLRQRNAAIFLLRRGDFEAALPLLGRRDDPTIRTRLINELRYFGVRFETLLEGFAVSDDPVIRQAWLLAAATYSPQAIPDRSWQSMIRVARQTAAEGRYQAERSGADWLLRQWQVDRESRPEESNSDPPARRDWETGPLGITFVTIPGPTSFRMGSPVEELGREGHETPLEVTLEHSFQVSVHEITVEQYREYSNLPNPARPVTPSQTCPMNRVTFLDAIRFCRWLSDREKLDEAEMCYPPLDEIDAETIGRWDPEKALNRTGYRLLTEAEWEYACRAGSRTAWSFGHDPDDLADYGWYAQNSQSHLWPVGQLLPNQFGLFDLYGNAGEWCLAVKRTGRGRFTLRGGAYNKTAIQVRSAQSFAYGPDQALSFTGFRIGRTVRDAPSGTP